jgi:hypothetical protein
MPTIDIPDDELAAVTAALRRLIRGPTSFRTRRGLDPLRAALARLEAASALTHGLEGVPKAAPAGKGENGLGDS